MVQSVGAYNILMRSQKVQNILNGIPSSLTSTEILELESVCTTESYPLDKLIQIARTLFKNDSEQCFKFLEYVEKTEINRNRNKDFQLQPLKMQIFYSLAALSLSKGLRESDKHQSEKWQKQFNKYLNLGSSVKTSAEKMYQLLHGFNSYYSGDFGKAMTNFHRLEQQQHPDKKQPIHCTVALLGLAQSNFMLRKYEKSLEYYKKALISNKKLPAKARLGMAYCFYELEKYELAEKCFQRILALQPNSAQAYLGIAVVKHKNGHLKQYFSYLKKAYELKPHDPLIILHISEHFLISEQFDKCVKMSTKGLEMIESMPRFLRNITTNHRDDYETLKARFNNLIGQAHHARGEFEQARKYYQLAKQKNLRYNEILLAQTITHNNQPNSFKDSLKILQSIFHTTKTTDLKIIAQFYKTLAYLQIKAQSKWQSQEASPNHYYKEAIKYNKNDYDALIDYSVYLADTNDRKNTLKIYQNALRALEIRGKEPKPELLNNIAVSLIEEKNIEDASKFLDKAQQALSTQQKLSQDDQIKYNALFLTISFNRAICLEAKYHFLEALEIHQNLIELNKFYIDSYIKKADILHQMGRKTQAYSLLNEIISECNNLKIQEVRVDRLYAMKGHLQHLDGYFGEARDSFKKIGKNLMPYDQLYELCIGYQLISKKQADKNLLKDFLRPNRQLCIMLCESDPHNVFAYMMLTILFLVDNKITKEQGIQYFNQLKIAEQEFPEIQYNYGVFSLLSEEYENALFCFNRYKEKTRSSKADEYISLAYFLKGDFAECLKTIKKNIINEPQNLRYRYQYAYANEKMVQKLYEQQKNFKDIKLGTKYLTMSKKIYEALSKIGSMEYIKIIQNPQLKQRTKNQISKLRSYCQDRDRFVQSQLGYYGNKEKQIFEKERRLKEEEARKLDELKRVKESQLLMQELGEDEEESDTEKVRRERRKKLEELSLRQTEEANEQWKIFKEKQQEKAELGQQLKKKRKNNQGKKPKRQRKQPQQEKEDEMDYQSQQQFKDNNMSEEEPPSDEESGKKKKKKKKNRDRSGSDEDKKKRKKKKRERKERKERGDDDSDPKDEEERSEAEDEDKISEKGSNPYDDVDLEEKLKEQREEELKPRKPKKKKKDDDDDEIDINQFVL